MNSRAGRFAAHQMNPPYTTTAPVSLNRRGRAARFALRAAAATSIGFISGTIGYAVFSERMSAVQAAWADAGLLIYYRAFGYTEFCLWSVYATCFGLLARRASGRLVAALVAWLATVCAATTCAGASRILIRAVSSG